MFVYARSVCVFVTHNTHNNVCACDGMGLCVCVFVFMKGRETTNNTMLTKIQGCAFVKVTSIHLAWQSALYLFSCRHMSPVLLGCLCVDGVTWEENATLGCCLL